MQNDMRDRLIELLQQTGMLDSESRCEIAAEKLLANGVIVPPCEEGDTLYAICTDGNILECVVDKIQISILVGWQLSTMRFNCDNFSRYFFLTREEVERALKGRESNA